MANVERLTKRVKKVEKWMEENEEMGGPKGILDTMSFLVNEARGQGQQAQNWRNQFEQFKGLVFEFFKANELESKWDEFLVEKENAVQEQQTEEVPLQEEAQDSEETSETSEDKEE